MSSYRCKGTGEMLPLLLWTDKPQLLNTARIKELARRVALARNFRRCAPSIAAASSRCSASKIHIGLPRAWRQGTRTSLPI